METVTKQKRTRPIYENDEAIRKAWFDLAFPAFSVRDEYERQFIAQFPDQKEADYPFYEEPNSFGKTFDPTQIYPLKWWGKHGFGTSFWVADGARFGSFTSSFLIRDIFIKILSFSIPAKESLEAIAKFAKGSRIVEYMAGSGYWAWLLKRYFNVDITPTDKHFDHYPLSKCAMFGPMLRRDVRKITPPPDAIVMMSWIPYGSNAADKLLKRMKSGQKLILIGEGSGASCADDSTFEILDNEFEVLEYHKLAQFSGLHDAMWFYQKK